MNFQYSPGLLGYGAKGADGSAGIEGMGLYYTDYDINADRPIIERLIRNNESLFSTDLAGTKLPGGRQYIDNEIFFDKSGQVCTIDDVSSGSFSDTGEKFSTVQYFSEAPESPLTDTYFERYSNIFRENDVFYIIDNVYSKGKIKYTRFPNTIYGISPKNFARIEHSSIVDSSSNPFTIYSSGIYRYDDDNQSLGIVRNVSNNTFRIGTGEILKDNTLLFDVSSLRKNTTPIRNNTPSGEIISNAEVSCNGLFSGVFNPAPDSFLYASIDISTIRIQWDLADFTSDPCIHADLHIYPVTTSAPKRSIVLSDIESSGWVNLTDIGIDGSYYYCEINFTDREGWNRSSARKYIIVSGQSYTLTVTDPVGTLNASANGYINGSPTYTVTFDTNAILGWTAGQWYPTYPDWISVNPASADSYSSNEQFVITVSPNTTTSSRLNGVTISTGGLTPPAYITIYQDASIVPVADSISANPQSFYDITWLSHYEYTTITASGSWTASIYDDPDSMIITSGTTLSGSGNTNAAIRVSKNEESFTKVATIRYTRGTAYVDVLITQESNGI